MNTKKAGEFLHYVNTQYHALHRAYETLFWDSYMGNADVGKEKDVALGALAQFRSNPELKAHAETLLATAKGTTKERLQTWVDFFAIHQLPPEAVALQEKIHTLETTIQQKRAKRTEGYIDPTTKIFVPASVLKMRTLVQTHPDEKIRKACFVAQEKLAVDCLPEYVTLVNMRNEFARLLGYTDFYDYKLRAIDKLTKEELFGKFAEITTATAQNKQAIRGLEKTKPGVRQPWNFAYMMSGDFTKEEDQYYPFDQAVERWLTSFARLGVTFAGGRQTLDLVERPGKYNNGFCHWPELVRYEGTKRHPASANFTCNITPGQVGSGVVAYQTLFHEGGHAAHFLNVTERDVCLAHEYAPMTAAWAETQSMFMDTIFDSIEWKVRYAKNDSGEAYPFALFERKLRALALLRPLRMQSIIFTCAFERAVYELKNPTPSKITAIAKAQYRIHYDHTTDSLRALTIPHLYAWESACMYHGYGLADIAVLQWREYFYKKYGTIVDNKAIGKEMIKAWAWGARYDFKTAVKRATGKSLSTAAYIKHITAPVPTALAKAKKRIQKLPKQRAVDFASLRTTVTLVHGKKVVADSSKGLNTMTKTYGTWLKTLK